MKCVRFMTMVMFAGALAVSCSGGGSDGGGSPGNAVVSISAIPGVVVPVPDAIPDITAIETEQYTGTIVWSPADNPFKAATVYTAFIELSPKAGYTMTGVAENFFTVAGATAINETDSGSVTAVFPTTGIAVQLLSVEQTGGVSGTADSTGLTLTFDINPTTLTADNITVLGATKGTLSGLGTMRSIAISNIAVANGAMVSVTVTSPAGYSITGSPKTALVYRFPAGYKETRTADGVSFVMAYVPAGLTFPTGNEDRDTATVPNTYWIGETEVTYELWNKVYTWATDSARGANQYYFANAGRQGGDGNSGPVGNSQHPVTMVNWHDCIVWCNALTEWYNAQTGGSYDCVYVYSNSIIRDSRDSNAVACDGAVAISSAKGFRLLSSNEWELAARYRNGILWTYGDHVSGDDSGACYDDGSTLGGLGKSTVFGNYAVYSGNADSTAAVKTKIANALNLYDMSGNIMEYCFDQSNQYGWGNRVLRGSSWYDGESFLQLVISIIGEPSREDSYVGFRFARSQ